MNSKKIDLLLKKIEQGSKLLDARQLKGGISAHMTALKIISRNGKIRRIIIRFPGGQYSAKEEYQLLSSLQSLNLSTPKTIYLDQSRQIFDKAYLVLDYIEGKSQLSLPKDGAVQMAERLTAIHQNGRSLSYPPFLTNQQKKFNQWFAVRPNKLDNSLGEKRIREVLETAWPFANRNRPTLLHGDFWPGNILWQDQKISGIVDWEDAEIGDPLFDISISRLDILWIFGLDAMNQFTRHYQALNDIDYSNLPYWDLCSALRPMFQIAEWSSGYSEQGRPDINEKTMREGHKFFVDQALQKL